MLEHLKPERVFRFFEEISAIPRGSGNTGKISDYCVDFAADRGLECHRDGLNNVVIKKPASKGYSDHPAVILQGHLDMVCEKTANSAHDFSHDPLSLCVKDDLVYAKDTTLGADDGIAIAMALAVLDDDDIAHPPIEAVFTVDEETGMYGADGLDVSGLCGSTLINIDSGEEGVLTVGCAGGAKIDFDMPLSFNNNFKDCYRITVSGLLGGHSGIDINKGRQNADALMGRLVASLPGENNRVVCLHGGFKDNVIPNACECVVATDTNPADAAEKFSKEIRVCEDPGLEIKVEAVKTEPQCLDAASSQRVIHFISNIPTGVMAMSRSMPDQVESSQNLGVVNVDAKGFSAVMSVRSSIAEEKEKLIENILSFADSLGINTSVRGHYPAWEYRENSRIRRVMTEAYADLFGREPKIETVHAGLECGLFSRKIEGFDAVSIGPDMWDIHTVNERLSISSTERTYVFLCETLKRL